VKARTAWLGGLLCVGCAMLPTTLEPAQVRYFVRTDWEGAPLESGARIIETDLGYTVAISSFQLRTTSIELVPCEPLASLDLGPTRALAHGSSYEHDISAIEPGVMDDLMLEEAQALGYSIATRSAYCELFSVHGTGRDEVVVSLVGWYLAPGSDEPVPFAAEHSLGVTDVAPLSLGAFDDALLPDEAEVVITRFPARAFDGLPLDELPEVDLAYEVGLALLRTREIRWAIGSS